MAQNDFLPFATGAGSNVQDQASWAANPARATGFVGGLAKSIEANKAIRQPAFISAGIAEWVNEQLVSVPILDDGNLAEWIANFNNALHRSFISDAPVDGNTYARHLGTWVPCLPLTGGTLSGDLYAPNVHLFGNLYMNGNYLFYSGATSAGPLLYMDSANAYMRPGNGNGVFYWYNSAGTPNAQVNMATGDIYTPGSMAAALDIGAGRNVTGANVYTSGSLFVGGIQLYNGGGGWLTGNFNLNLGTGSLSMQGSISASGNITSGGTVSGTTISGTTISGSYLYSSGDISGAGSLGMGTDATINRNLSVGAALFAPQITGTQPNGNLIISGGLVLYPAGGANDALHVNGNIFIAGNEVQGPVGGLNFYGGIIVQAMSGSLDSQWNYGNLRIFNGNGYQVGGGLWSDSSDARVKKDIEPYSRGLEAIRKLRPVTYSFNGLGGTTDSDERYTGLVAQDVLSVMPEIIFEKQFKLHPDDTEDTSIYQMNATALLYALVNTVQELTARLEAVETR